MPRRMDKRLSICLLCLAVTVEGQLGTVRAPCRNSAPLAESEGKADPHRPLVPGSRETVYYGYPTWKEFRDFGKQLFIESEVPRGF